MIKLKESLELIKLLRIDAYMAFFMFAYGVSQVPNVELIQDKVCLYELDKTELSCSSLSSTGTSDDNLQSTVLTMATSIRNYQTLVATIPGVIQSFFFGYWIDKYPSHIRTLLILPCSGILIQSIIMIYQCVYFDVAIINSLWGHLAFGLSGGSSLVLAASFTYAAKKTPQKFRSIRFAIVDCFIFIAYPIGVAVGGKILAMNPWFDSEKRNFTAIFVTSAISMVIAIIWTIVCIEDLSADEPSNAVTSEPKVEDTMTEVDLNDGSKVDKVKSEAKTGAWEITADIFNFKNVYLTIKTFFRDRPDEGRKKIHLLAGCLLGVYISLLAETMIGFQYTEKAFSWDYKYYSNTYFYLQLVQSFGTVAGSLFIKHTLKLGDADVAAIGTLSHFLGNLIKGIPTVRCYIAGSLAFCLSGIAIPAIRSCLTRLIDFNEIGQILSIISCLQALGPIFASMQTSQVFEATIDSAPGTVYHFLAASVIPPLIIEIWIGLKSEGTEIKTTATKVRFEIGDGNEVVDIQGIGDSENERKF